MLLFSVLGIIFSCSTIGEVVMGVDVASFWEEEGLTMSDVPWVKVTNRASLEKGLKCRSCILSMQVNNGTEWLHLGGDINTFLPIVTEHSQSAATSDLTLEQTLSLVKEKMGITPSKIGVYISFLTPGIAPSSISVMSSIFPEPSLPFPLIVSANVLDASGGESSTPLMDGQEFLSSLADLVPGATPVLGWSTYHGMDKVWKRIENDEILKQFQTSRIVRVVEHLYSDPEKIPKEDVRFVELLQKKLERTNPTSFTELAVEQLVKSIETNGHHKLEKDPFAPRYASRPPRKDPVRELLPEYYLSSSSYSAKDVDSMLALVRGKGGVGFAVRAGLVSNQADSSHVVRLVNTVKGGFVVVTTDPADRESRDIIKQFVKNIGSDKVIVSLEKDIVDEADLVNADDGRIPQPRNSQLNIASDKNPLTILTVLTSLILILILRLK